MERHCIVSNDTKAARLFCCEPSRGLRVQSSMEIVYNSKQTDRDNVWGRVGRKNNVTEIQGYTDR